MRIRHLAAALALSVVAAGCSAAGATSDPATAPAPSETATTELTGVAAEAEGRTVIDVRTPAEVADGHVVGALTIDLQDPGFREAIAELPRDEPYFVYCRSGNRSAQAIDVMRELGFTDLVNGGGFEDLARAGLPTTS